MTSRMRAKGISAEFCERIFKQIRGFGEYGFPESHAASFALISYAMSYLKCHYPAEFTCALLNAQPLGFYTPATIIEDAKRHGVKILPVDTAASSWDCTLEPVAGSTTDFAVRIGLRYVKGLGETDAQAIAAAGRTQDTLDDFVEASGLDQGDLASLARSGALDGKANTRRSALWGVRRLAGPTLPLPLPDPEPLPTFDPLTTAEEIAWDYDTTGLSPIGHPLESLRPALRALGLPDARTVVRMPNGRRVKYAGAVICRQRPATASGVVFMTLEDETGLVNVVLWRKVFDEYPVLARTASLLGIAGTLQVEQGVVHLVAERLFVPKIPAPLAPTVSRDFH
jgi:error-prone DNA polymerase